jgi:cell division septation protein DedD
MTTSYIKDKVEELRAQKKLDRAKEEAERLAKEEALAERKRLSDERIAKKQAIIDAGGVVPNPTPVVEEKPKKVVKETKKEVKETKKEVKETKKPKKTVTKVAPKKKGRPKGSKNKK